MHTTKDQQGILLSSGTNELEIVEFGIDRYKFGINVIKVREIISPMEITPIPHAHPNVEGIIELRGEVLPVVDVAKALGYPPSPQPDQDKYIVAEFNKLKIVFHVHSVTQIHRISWTQIEKPNEMYQGLETEIIGVVKHHDAMILLLDFEKIVVDINPESGISVERIRYLGERTRSEKKIVLAEDSILLRRLIADTLSQAGYTDLIWFDNGKQAIDYLESLVSNDQQIEDFVQMVVTDIEMPQLDGHHLTSRIKSHPKLNKLPVVIFSSLITDDLRHKGESVGASAQVSKPEIGELVELIDQLVL
ncbi:MAG: chemotaxis protein [Bacilli bacterium]